MENNRCIHHLLAIASKSSYLDDLNDSQRQAVLLPSDSISRVVAGPGSGKTRVLTSRIVHLVSSSSKERVLGVTFTKKAAGEMQRRVEEMLRELELSEAYQQVTLGTFHSVCAKILRWNGDLLVELPTVKSVMVSSSKPISLSSSFAIADHDEQVRIVKDIMKEKNVVQEDMTPNKVLNMLGKLKAKHASGEDPTMSSKDKPAFGNEKLAQELYLPYRHALWTSNLVDFDDLIFMAKELLDCHSDVRESLQARWPHILVDEFQDTSSIQMDLVKLLTSNSVLVVGDADQSIYSWRGAHAGSLADFADSFQDHSKGEVQTVYLMENYRSTSKIVEAAQRIIDGSGASSGADKLRQNMKPKREAGRPPRIVSCEDSKHEAEFVIKTIDERVKKEEYTPETSVAIIYRTNAQSRFIEEACVKRNLPYVIFGSATSFYNRKEIKDCLSYLRWMNNGFDRASMHRCVASPKRGIGDSALGQFDKFASYVIAQQEGTSPGPSPFDVLLSFSGSTDFTGKVDFDTTGFFTSRQMNVFVEFSQQMRSIRDYAEAQPVANLIGFVAATVNLDSHLEKYSKSKAELADRKANIVELQQAASRYLGPAFEFSDDATPLGLFLEGVALVDEMSNSDGHDDRFVVSLCTIHASKGMEFDAVFVVGNEEGTMPTYQAITEGEDSLVFEEERRLCYVAMTRAKSELFLTWRQEVPIFTGAGISYKETSRSRFLDPLVSKKKGTRHKGEKTREPPGNTGRVNNKAQSQASRIGDPTRGKATAANRARRFASPMPVREQERNDIPLRTPIKAVLPRRSVKTTPVSSQKTQQHHPDDTTVVARHVHRPTRPTKAAATEKMETTPVPVVRRMDSTLFYPVGSSVRHKELGPGRVLEPLQASTVLVEFEDGVQQEFDASGNEISIAL